MPTLEWLTRKTDITADARVPYRLLEEVPELSCTERDPATENMIIQGDNLDALKSLLPFYAGKVKCIFIDPPYNTKSAFEHYDDNLEHSQWLAMMYPRLALLRELLVEDGIFFVVLDDREIHYLKVICDEVFGRKNFCGSLVWEKKKKPSFLNANMGIVTDYILAYAKNRGGKPIPFVFGTTTADKMTPLNNAGNAEKVLEFPAGRVEFGCSDQTFEPQEMSEGNIKTKLLDMVVVENGRNRDSFRLWGEWRYSQAKLNEVATTEDSLWISKSPFRPNHIKGGGAPKKLKNLLSKAHYEMASNEDATKESIALFGETNAFDYPKPEMLAQILIGATTESEKDIVLDSFLGSGTTAAVAHKMGRRYIGIEMGEHAVTHCVPRLRKVVEGEQGGISKLVQPFALTKLQTPNSKLQTPNSKLQTPNSKLQTPNSKLQTPNSESRHSGTGTGSIGWQGGGGFRFYRLGKTIFNAEGEIDPEIKFPQLAAHIWFTETRTPRHTRRGEARSPLLGVHHGTAYYLLYNGILGDRSVTGGNVLTRAVLAALPPHDGPRVIYGESCRLSDASLERLNITFKQTPYDVRAE